MKEKLTLSIDKKVKEKAKKFARIQGKSISQMVQSYLESLSSESTDPIQKFGKNPVDTGVQDASEEHDRYIYSSEK